MSPSDSRRARRRAAGRRDDAATPAAGPSAPGSTRAARPEPPACRARRAGKLRHVLSARPPARWYGAEPAWQVALEASARREYAGQLTYTLAPGRLIYRIGLEVVGRIDPVPITIEFWAIPLYNCYGLDPADYPRVYAEPGAESPHRMHTDDALCLWYPADPATRRWTADKGLLDLLDIIADHLLYEQHWRATGGKHGGIWAGDQAEHGFTTQGAA